jgi:hypothetical protein
MKDVWLFLQERGKLLLLPVVLIILIAGALVIFSSHSAVAPFIYTVF